MQGISHYLHLPTIPSVFTPSHYVSSETMDKISAVGRNALVELGVALTVNLAFNFAVGFFFLPASANLLTVLAAASVLTVMAVAIIKIWRSCYPPDANPSQQSIDSMVHHVNDAARGVARLSIVNTLTIKLTHYIHELGHAGAATLCYIGANPEIMVRWYEGSTEYITSHGLTKFGQYLGEFNALLFVTAAGLCTPVACAMTEFAVAHQIHESHPVISEILNYHGLSQLLNVGIYGLSAFYTSKMVLQNDYILLWVVGEIHPAIPIALIIGLPLCEYLIFKYLDYRKEGDPATLTLAYPPSQAGTSVQSQPQLQ